MANDTTSTPLLYVCDTIGIISETPIYISSIYFIPNANADDVTFKQWNEDAPVAAGTKALKTGTITNGTTLTSTGNLPSTVADGYIFHIKSSSGAAANIGREVVTTAGDDDAVICSSAGWTNEASKVYSWTTYPTTTAFVLKGNSADTNSHQVHFPYPRRFPNLSLDVIDGGTVYLYLAKSAR
jgi:hypothetical protein